MKKVVLGLMLVMGLSLVGCGNAKDEVVNGGGFTPSKPSTETVVETEKEEVVSLEMSVEEMKEYYNDNQFVGTPRVIVCNTWLYKDIELRVYTDWETYNVEPFKGCENNNAYYVIFTDNGTPDDFSDDEIAYIFTTPIE